MTRWTSRSLGSRLQHGIFYLLIRIGGRKAAYALLFWVVLWFMFKPESKKRSTPYLRRRFPGSGPLGLWRHRWRLQWELGKVLVDRAVAGIHGLYRVDTADKEMEVLFRLQAEGKGVILLSAHIGSWQVSMSILTGSLPSHAYVVLYRDAGDLDRHYFEHAGKEPSFTIIDPAEGPGSAVAMLRALTNGDALCMMGDRLFGDSQACRTHFLNDAIRVPFTPYYLASITGAPIVVFFSPRTGPGTVRNHIAKVIRVPEGLGKKPEAYEPYARMYAEAIETCVAKLPYQFFNFYNMWDSDGD